MDIGQRLANYAQSLPERLRDRKSILAIVGVLALTGAGMLIEDCARTDDSERIHIVFDDTAETNVVE